MDEQAMDIFQTYGKEIIALIVPFVTWFLNVGIKARAKLIWASPHSFSFLVPEPLRDANGIEVSSKQLVNTASIKIINIGRETANKVELVFNYKPQFLNLWPVRHFEQRSADDGRHSLIFENLSPKEEIGLEIMAINGELPHVLLVRCAECTAKNVSIVWFRHVEQWKIKTGQFLMMAGLGSLVYILITLVQYLVLKTPS
ncbi:hypothetical protein [Aeromonas rivipollensis]|uniref:hypothetical protein n=1 Tax=Aeromonas rivipollensis TaxID=948519 RepID=UPI0030D18556